MIILDAGLDDGAIEASVKKATDSLPSSSGARVERWGKRRLAYEIDHRTDGNYVLVKANAEPSTMAELHRSLSLSDEVIRHKVIRIPDKQAARQNSKGAESK